MPRWELRYLFGRHVGILTIRQHVKPHFPNREYVTLHVVLYNYNFPRDDVVVCSLHPSNDYKTVRFQYSSILRLTSSLNDPFKVGSFRPQSLKYPRNMQPVAFSTFGVSKSNIMTGSISAISFWQYQIHQEKSAVQRRNPDLF